MAKRKDAAAPEAETAPAPPVGSVVLEDVGDALPDDGYDAHDYRIRVGGVYYDHVGDAPDGRWIYRKH
jgi:hypothetical protein